MIRFDSFDSFYLEQSLFSFLKLRFTHKHSSFSLIVRKLLPLSKRKSKNY